VNLGIGYRLSLACNDSYTKSDMVVHSLIFSMSRNSNADSIECGVNVSIDGIRAISITLSKKFVVA